MAPTQPEHLRGTLDISASGAGGNFCCLGIETATERAGVALASGAKIFVREARGTKAPSRSIYEWTRSLFDECGIEPSELDCIAFGQGPGSFTGVRVAASLAQGLGYSLGVPVCAVSSLAALAATAAREAPGLPGEIDAIACCLDARMGQVYFSVYSPDGQTGRVADALLDPNDIQLTAGMRYLAVGSGWAHVPRLEETLGPSLVAVQPDLLPSAIDVVGLARARFGAGQVVEPRDALPNYLRDRVTAGAA